MGLGLSLKTVAAAAILVALAVASAPVAAEPMRAADIRAYYVEFRVAENGVYGHSYIAYGRLNAAGQPISAAYADIHPIGDFPSMVLGHFVPMEATTRPDPDTLVLPIANRFRRTLSAAEFRQLTAAIARTRALAHAWSIIAYNCNDFVADVARGIGMQTPSTLALPYDFIPMLRAMNMHTPRRQAMAATGAIAPLRRTALVR